VVISVLAPTELDASDELQPCGSDEPLPCGSDEPQQSDSLDPQTSGLGQIKCVEWMDVDSSEVSALPCHLQKSGPDKAKAWTDQVFQLGETMPTAPRMNTHQPVHVKEELERKWARDANITKKEWGERLIWGICVLYVVGKGVCMQCSKLNV